MGLTIHYTLTLPAELSRVDAVRRVEQLRRRAAAIEGIRVDTAVRECHGPSLKKEQAKGFFLGCIYVPVTFDGSGRPQVAADWRDSEVSVAVDPDELAFFGVRVPGSETAFFGVGRLPGTFEQVGEDGAPSARLDVPRHGGRWFAEWGCKTQYASDPALGGDENFLRAHLSVVAVLDAALELGFGVEVMDEGNYRETRDVSALLKELGRNNRLVAGFAGMLKDRLGPGNLAAPILARADFERLEASAPADGIAANFEGAFGDLLRMTKRRA
ncbi:MAG: hypothetical protein AAB074_13855 [Planctomycetota bacterium]